MGELVGRVRSRLDVESYWLNVSRSFLRVLVASRRSAEEGFLCGSLWRWLGTG